MDALAFCFYLICYLPASLGTHLKQPLPAVSGLCYADDAHTELEDKLTSLFLTYSLFILNRINTIILTTVWQG